MHIAHEIKNNINPDIAVDTVTLDSDTAQVGKSIGVEITVSNSGTEAARVATVCDIAGTGQYAEMTPIFAVLTLAPGQTDTVDMKWSYGQSGSAGLVCSVNNPAQLLDSSLFLTNLNMTARYGDSVEVEWGDKDQGEIDSMLVVGLPQINLGSLAPGESRSWEWVIKGRKKIEVSPTHPRSFVNSLTIDPKEIK